MATGDSASRAPPPQAAKPLRTSPSSQSPLGSQTSRVGSCAGRRTRKRRDLRDPPLLLHAAAACAECSEYELDDVDLRLARRFLPEAAAAIWGTTTFADAETACCDAPAPEPGAGVGVRETLKSVSSNSRGETGRSSSFGVRSGADVDADADDSTNSACGFRTGLGREGGCARGVGTSGGEGSRG